MEPRCPDHQRTLRLRLVEGSARSTIYGPGGVGCGVGRRRWLCLVSLARPRPARGFAETPVRGAADRSSVGAHRLSETSGAVRADVRFRLGCYRVSLHHPPVRREVLSVDEEALNGSEEAA